MEELGANEAARAQHENWPLKLANSGFENRIDLRRDSPADHDLSIVSDALIVRMRPPAPLMDLGPTLFDGISAIRKGQTDIREPRDV